MAKPIGNDLAEPVTVLVAERPSVQTGSPHQCRRRMGAALIA